MTFYILVFLSFNLIENPVSGAFTATTSVVSTAPYPFKEKQDCEDAFDAIQAQNLTVRYAHKCTALVHD